MFGSIAALSKAQHDRLDGLMSDAEGDGQVIDGLLIDNPLGNFARIVLVIGDEPATGSEYDRTFSFDGLEVARGEESTVWAIEQVLASMPGDSDLVA